MNYLVLLHAHGNLFSRFQGPRRFAKPAKPLTYYTSVFYISAKPLCETLRFLRNLDRFKTTHPGICLSVTDRRAHPGVDTPAVAGPSQQGFVGAPVVLAGIHLRMPGGSPLGGVTTSTMTTSTHCAGRACLGPTSRRDGRNR